MPAKAQRSRGVTGGRVGSETSYLLLLKKNNLKMKLDVWKGKSFMGTHLKQLALLKMKEQRFKSGIFKFPENFLPFPCDNKNSCHSCLFHRKSGKRAQRWDRKINEKWKKWNEVSSIRSIL